MYVPDSQHPAMLLLHQRQHSLDAQGGAGSAVHRTGSVIPCGGVCLAFGYDPGGVKQAVRPGNLRNVQGEGSVQSAAQSPALVAWHMHPQRILRRIPGQKLINRCMHRLLLNQIFQPVTQIPPCPLDGAGDGGNVPVQLLGDLGHAHALIIV